MSQPKLSQTALYDVLVAEIESFKATKQGYDKSLQETSALVKRLEELYKEPIPVDIQGMRAEHARIQDTLRKWLYFPKWLVISFLCLVLGFCISVFFNSKQYFTNKELREDIRQAVEYIQKLKEQIPDKHKAKQ